MVEIARIERSLSRPRFLERVFGPEERAALNKKSGSRLAQSAAAAFAAKEAFSKALGTGIRGFGLQEVQLLHDDLGAPCLRLSGRAAAMAAERRLEFAVSVTHTAAFAAAVVTAYTESP